MSVQPGPQYRLPIPDNDAATNALHLVRWLTTNGPSATAKDLREAGRRLEDSIMDLHGASCIPLRNTLEEAEGDLQELLGTIRRVLRA